MSEPIYRIDKDAAIYDSDLIASYAAMDGQLDHWVGALVPVELDYEAMIEAHYSEFGHWMHTPEAKRLLNAALGVGGDDAG